MSVRIKTLIVLCLTFVTLAGILYFAARWVSVRDALVIDQKSTSQGVTRLILALNDQVNGIDVTVSDWAPWDDTYAFISTGDPAYIASNLPDNSSFTNIGVELMLFIDNSGHTVFGKMVDLHSRIELPFPQGLSNQFQPGSPLLSQSDPAHKVAGILLLPDGPWIIAAQPILNSHAQGPARGMLIMGRRLDREEIKLLSHRTQLSIDLFPLNSVLPAPVALARKSLATPGSIEIVTPSTKLMTGYARVDDLFGQPALILQVDTVREAYIQANKSLIFLCLALLTSGVVLGLVALLGLERLVMRRLAGLTANVRKIGSQASASARLEATGNDEIFTLATTVNSMLASLEKSQKRELENEEKYRTLFNNAEVGMFRTRLDGSEILDINQKFLSILGRTRAEVLGSASRLYWAEQRERDELVRRLTAEGHLTDFECGMLNQQGQVRRCLTSLRLDREQGILEGSIQDITERKLAEAGIQEMNGRLEQRVQERTRELEAAQEKLLRQEKLAVLGQLAGGVGHELRNPLGVISASIYYLKMVLADAGRKVSQHLDTIEQEVYNASRIVGDLLDYARVTTAERKPLPPAGLLQAALERFKLPARVELCLEMAQDLPPVHVDGLQVQQVLGNLIVNACQAMPDGGRLTISASREGDMLRIVVADTGTGILPENMPKIFEPLFTTKVTGIGLGLAVSKKLVEANGGRLQVISDPGHGTAFTLYLPVEPSPAAATP